MEIGGCGGVIRDYNGSGVALILESELWASSVV
ncbi:uncharacterized protein G2W53_028387 [Senna tora]|uniref:Uncharacterized protein n=1 Tax=Senna tora TaxID=362788 RepID=A0A834T0U5_9FABA|nr:uncharacterized protein G2W53_028387 [Senna tora]